MAILDDIEADPSPIKATIDFSNYDNGEKFSTLARKYFDKYAVPLGATTMEDYFAALLLMKLKETLHFEVADTLYRKTIMVAEELANQKRIELEQQRQIAIEQVTLKKQEIDQVALLKK